MNISVGRYSFFSTPQGTLRYSETSPPQPHEEHQVCNCTRSVAERPAGTPSEVKQSIHLQLAEGEDTELQCSPEALYFTWRWKEEVPMGVHPHAYFWIYPKTSSIQIELSHRGYGLVDCFFGRLYFGNKIDISRFYNGHSPSELVNLNKLTPEDVWCHCCSFGVEAMRIFEHSEEKEFWQELMARARNAGAYTDALLEQTRFSVDEIRVAAEAPILLDFARWAYPKLNDLRKRLTETELFRYGDAVYRETHPEKP